MGTYLAEDWRPRLEAAGIVDFDAFWAHDLELVDAPNRRGNGWSEVGRLEIPGSDRAVYVKRQCNYVRRTLWHPFRGEPTLAWEFRNIRRFDAAGLPNMDVVFFGSRRIHDDTHAVLVTAELAGFEPLDRVAELGLDGLVLSRDLRLAILRHAAELVARMHEARLEHRCLYPKYLFLRVAAGRPEIHFIDLEKARRHRFGKRFRLRDLDSLNRRARHWSRADRLRFLHYYLGTRRLDAGQRRFCRRLAMRASKR